MREQNAYHVRAMATAVPEMSSEPPWADCWDCRWVASGGAQGKSSMPATFVYSMQLSAGKARHPSGRSSRPRNHQNRQLLSRQSGQEIACRADSRSGVLWINDDPRIMTAGWRPGLSERPSPGTVQVLRWTPAEWNSAPMLDDKTVGRIRAMRKHRGQAIGYRLGRGGAPSRVR